jgi:phage head maturation protease
MENHHTLTFAVTPTPTDEDGPVRFAGLAYSGGVIPGYGNLGDAAIDLASLRLPERAVFALVDHDPKARAGQLRAEVRDGGIHVEGHLFRGSSAGQEVAALFAEGAPWQLSVGLQARVEHTPKPRPIAINGQALRLHTVFRDASLREVSFVPVGADPGTRVAAFALTQEDPRMTDHSDDAPDLAAMQRQIATLTAERDAALSALAQLKRSVRDQALTTLAVQLGRDLEADERDILGSIDDRAYAVLSASLLRKPPVPEHLLREQATDGRAPVAEAERASQARDAILHQFSLRSA